MPHVIIIANPTAGRGRAITACDAAVARLRTLGVEPEAHQTTSAADTRERVRAAVAARPDAIVLVGGDGTLRGVLDELVDCAVPLALIPAGTGNDLARALGIPFGSAQAAAQAAELAVTGTPRAIDLGEAHCPEGVARFATIAALGFDAKVAETTNRLRWPRGALRYYVALVLELLRLRPMPFTVRVEDGDAITSPGTLIAVGNTRSYGGGMPICPDADPCDGALDLVQVAPLGRLRLITLFPRLLRGTHTTLPQVAARRAREVQLSAPGLVVYADGERVGSGEVGLRVVPGALRVLVP